MENLKGELSEHEEIIVTRLENYASELDMLIYDVVNNRGIGKFDFAEFFSYIESIIKTEIDDGILRYCDYLYGAALPMYDDKLVKNDCTDESELLVVNKATCWLDVLGKLSDTDLDELDSRLNKGMGDQLIPHLKFHGHTWAVMIGYRHYWHIMEHREKTGESSPYRIKSFN